MSFNSSNHSQANQKAAKSSGNRSREGIHQSEQSGGTRNHLRGDYAGNENAEHREGSEAEGHSTKLNARMTQKSEGRTPKN